MKTLLLVALLTTLALAQEDVTEEVPDTALDLEVSIEDLDGAAAEAVEEDDGSEPSQIIYTGSGPVQGRKVTAADGSSHFEFLGIPYAQPPVGRLRFKPPQPVLPWVEPLEAFSDGPECVQEEWVSDGIVGTGVSEDCLTLNVFSNNVATFRRPLQPVMVWIHGGGFTQGSKNLYRMKGLLDEDVVFVAMNYRLHFLGFLSFGNDLVSGNMGLKDQQLAIQWVRWNIQHFGGDPNRITIFGESAGGVSVQAQVLSPWNNGILSGAVAQSGSALYLHFDKHDEMKKYARNGVEIFGCPTTLDQRTLDCLQKIPEFTKEMNKKLTDDEDALFTASGEVKYNFWPVVDSYVENPFIPMDPLEALKTGMFNRIPYMSGTVTYEGAMLVGFGRFYGLTGAASLNAFEIPAKTGFQINYGQDHMFDKIALKFYNHTTGDSDFEQELPAIDFSTDAYFLSSDQKSVELMSRFVKNVYNYYLTQKTNNSFLAKDMGLGYEYTPMHSDDLTFQIMTTSVDDLEDYSEEEKSTAKHFNRYLANFAKYGTPNTMMKSFNKQYEEESPFWHSVSTNEKVRITKIY